MEAINKLTRNQPTALLTEEAIEYIEDQYDGTEAHGEGNAIDENEVDWSEMEEDEKEDDTDFIATEELSPSRQG